MIPWTVANARLLLAGDQDAQSFAAKGYVKTVHRAECLVEAMAKYKVPKPPKGLTPEEEADPRNEIAWSEAV